MLNPHIKDSFWKIHLSNCGWLGILQRLLGGKRVQGCKWDWPPLFPCRWETRLRRGIRHQGSLFFSAFLSHALPLCSSTICLLPLRSRPTQSLSLLRRLVLNMPEQTNATTAPGGLSHLMTAWVAAQAETRWLTGSRKVAGSICSAKRTEWLCSGCPTLQHARHWSALEQGTVSKLIQVCFNANNPELLFNEMHVFGMWVD